MIGIVRRRAVVLLGSLACAAALTACSDDPPATNVAPAGNARTASPGPSETPVPALPDSVLAEPDGYHYAPAADVPATVTGLDPRFVAGYLGRALVRDGKPVGVVQVVRLRRDVDAEPFVESFVQQYAQTGEPGTERIDGEDVLTASRLRGRAGGLVSWRDGRDLVLVASPESISAARRLARAILGAGGDQDRP
jgi:hypothetical protein